MINLLYFPLVILTGIGLGILYFGGLWLTVRQLPKIHNPVLLTWVSFLGRMSIILVGFYLVIIAVPSFSLLYLLLCLASFFWIRNRILQRIGRFLNAEVR